jgi:hypothetical protein
MAKKKEGTKRRRRRSADEIIQDLQDEIRRVRSRQAARELKESPAHRTALAAVKALDRALDAAAEEGVGPLRHALADGRRALAAYLEAQGVRLPKPNLPKGPRPRDARSDAEE